MGTKLSLTAWGSQYIAELIKLGATPEDAMAYWVQSLVWPNGRDLIALTLDDPKVAAKFDIKYLKQERKPLE